MHRRESAMEMQRPLSLAPGKVLGPFERGASLNMIMSMLRNASLSLYGKCTLTWSDDHHPTSAMILSIQKPNLRLYFDGDSQRLTIIEQVAPISHTEYKGTTLASLASSGDIKRSLQRVFGATSAPQKHPEYSKEIMLCYPGVGFGISTDNKTLQRILVTAVAQSDAPSISSIFQSSLDVLPEPRQGILAAKAILGNKTDHQAQLELKLSHGQTVTVELGSTKAEDLLCDLGSPDRRHWKEDDRMAIHARHSSAELVENPYFMNYFALGVDFLMNPTTHVVIKIVMHNNIPGEALFGRYERCPWSIETYDGRMLDYRDARATLDAVFSEALTSKKQGRGKPDAKSEPSSTSSLDVVELDRGADLPNEDVIVRPTELIGYPNCVAEVTSSSAIETVWLL